MSDREKQQRELVEALERWVGNRPGRGGQWLRRARAWLLHRPRS